MPVTKAFWQAQTQATHLSVVQSRCQQKKLKIAALIEINKIKCKRGSNQLTFRIKTKQNKKVDR